ncbi:MAG TPA: ABC transporter permease [Anaerolineae bacterium]|nr:ABC transporter permease [Anaerolineae bacterium]
MKAIDIAIKDMVQAFRSAIALVFMFVIPLLVAGLFYFMFGNIASQGNLDVPAMKVVVADLDEGSPEVVGWSGGQVVGGVDADTLGELIVGVLQSKDLADLLEVSLAPDAEAARAAVDRQEVQVAIIIPADFSGQFAAPAGQAVIMFYQDPTLTIGPGIVKSILNQFMDGMAGAKIAVSVALQEMGTLDSNRIGQIVQLYLAGSTTQTGDPAAALLDVRASGASQPATNPLLAIVGPIMGGMMIFFAFYTGTATAQTILEEEEEQTLPRLFTTPTPQAVILTGKFLAVFLTVLVQVVVLLVAARLIFRIEWGELPAVALVVAGTVIIAASFGIFFMSLLKNAKQGGAIFGGVLTVTGMIGAISIFAQGSPTAQQLGSTVSLLVPQGWAVRGLIQAMNGLPVVDVLLTTLVMLAWSAAFFTVGVLRFNRRYA